MKVLLKAECTIRKSNKNGTHLEEIHTNSIISQMHKSKDTHLQKKTEGI